ncbi:hypothetical protein [Ktedonobacter racemifer]|uniref:hypothetical protein n=1 Tax=Ktedonobacter racemifer TaxID=363277 RepID=UPI0012F912C6|nr:hypothetical protein [Ktedonobacter racemifer]
MSGSASLMVVGMRHLGLGDAIFQSRMNGSSIGCVLVLFGPLKGREVGQTVPS